MKKIAKAIHHLLKEGGRRPCWTELTLVYQLCVGMDPKEFLFPKEKEEKREKLCLCVLLNSIFAKEIGRSPSLRKENLL